MSHPGDYKYRCQVPNCPNIYYSNIQDTQYSNKHFFRFPTDSISRQRWIDAINRNVHAQIDFTVKKTLYICEDHFEIKFFTSTLKTKLLNKFEAVPTIFSKIEKTMVKPINRSSLNEIKVQLTNNKELRKDVLLQKDRVINKIQNENKALQYEITEYKALLGSLKEEINQKDCDIKEMQKNMSTATVPKFDERLKDKEKTESEVKSEVEDHLLKLIEEQNEKLRIEREAHFKTKALLRLEKHNGKKAEVSAALRELECCRSGGYSSTTSLRAQDSSLKDRLELAEENIKALQTKLEIEQFERKVDIQKFINIIRSLEKTDTDNKE